MNWSGMTRARSKNQQVEFSYTSEIAGMEAGRQACNQMLQAVSDFQLGCFDPSK